MNSLSSISINRRFGGIQRLYGDDALTRFSSAKICVVGLGGVGSWAVEVLARSGVGHLTLIDLDHIAQSNVNRQIHALSDNFGKAKTIAMDERIKQINPQCQVHLIDDFITIENIKEYFRQPFDYVIDAIDEVRVKAAMAAYFISSKQAFAVSGGAGGRRHLEYIRLADLSHVTHDRMLANMRYQLRKNYKFPKENHLFNIPCVYSPETVKLPDSNYCNEKLQGLSCAGYGASMIVTATFGLYLAQMALEHIA